MSLLAGRAPGMLSRMPSPAFMTIITSLANPLAVQAGPHDADR